MHKFKLGLLTVATFTIGFQAQAAKDLFSLVETQLVVDITRGSGDADLYLHSSSPTTSYYTCRPWLSGNTETCTLDNPSAGTWHIGVHAYSTYSSVNMTWKYK